MTPLISIIVPVYGVEKYIERCAKSLFEQTYNNIEYIFVNDCTTDNSIGVLNSVIEKYPLLNNQIHIINHKKNGGLAAARKTGLLSALGEYVMHVDSDDWISTDAVESMLNSALSNNADIVVGNMCFSYKNLSKPLDTLVEDNKKQYLIRMLTRTPGYNVTLCNRLIRRQVHLQALPVDGLNFGEDYVTYIRAVYFANKVEKLNKTTYYYWQENEYSYCKTISQKSFNDIIRATDILCEFFTTIQTPFDKKIIDLIKVKNKVFLYQIGDYKMRQQAYGLYPEIKVPENQLNRRELIIYKLGEYRQFYLIGLLIRSGYNIKRIIRKYIKKSV